LDMTARLPKWVDLLFFIEKAWHCQAFFEAIICGKLKELGGSMRFGSSFFKRLIINPVMFTLVFGLLSIAFVNRIAMQPRPDEPLKLIEYLLRVGKPDEVEGIYQQLLEKDADNIDLHHQYIQYQFEIASKGEPPQTKTDLSEYYSGLASREETAGAGYYGLGRIAMRQGDYRQALDYFERVPDPDQKFLNFAIGLVYLKQGDQLKAEGSFQREIALEGNVSESTGQLADLYLEQGEYEKFQGLATNDRTAKYVRMGSAQQFALATSDWWSYFRIVILGPFRFISFLGGLNAIIICLVWIIFLMRIAVFHRKRFTVYLTLLIMGMISANISLVVNDLLHKVLTISPDGSFVRGLLSSILHIGFVEETAKFIPVLIFVCLARRVDDPFDLIAYGSFSALGFATLENAIYFSLDGLGILLSRFLYSTLVHIAMTAIICYAWARARYLQPENQAKAVLFGLAVAAVVHGTFDFFLGYMMSKAILLSYAISLVLVREYYRMICNTLNHSPYFDEASSRSGRLVNFELFISAAILLMFLGYLYHNFDFSTELANQSLINTGLTAVPAIIVFSGSLGKIGLARGKQLPVLKIRTFSVADNST